MLRDEEKLLRRVVTEFCESEVERERLRIERDGIPDSIIRAAAESGFLGALAPPELGGSGLDTRSYAVLLQVMSKYSTSLAYYVFLQNSLFIAPLLRFAREDVRRSVVPEVASGGSKGTLVQDVFRRSKNSLSYGDVLSGMADMVPLPSADHHLVLARSKDGDALVLSSPGDILERYRIIGLRGMEFGKVSYGGRADVVAEHGSSAVEGLMDEAAIPLSAMALGIVERAVEMAAQYSKEREAFGSKLSEFQPIAFYIADVQAQLRVLEEYLYSDSPDPLSAKVLSLDLARKASRMSIQVHGGYGYFEDVGVERLYRDAAALSSIAGNYLDDMAKLSRELLGDSAARI
mgnify:CR=1 FL=1